MIYGPIRPLARTFVTPSSFVAEDSLSSEILFPTPARSFVPSDFCNDAADSKVALHDELRRNFRSAKPATATWLPMRRQKQPHQEREEHIWRNMYNNRVSLHQTRGVSVCSQPPPFHLWPYATRFRCTRKDLITCMHYPFPLSRDYTIQLLLKYYYCHRNYYILYLCAAIRN